VSEAEPARLAECGRLEGEGTLFTFIFTLSASDCQSYSLPNWSRLSGRISGKSGLKLTVGNSSTEGAKVSHCLARKNNNLPD
jgi:hypothetical protein